MATLTIPTFKTYNKAFTVLYGSEVGAGISTLVEISDFHRILYQLEKMYISRGSLATIKHIKALRLMIYRYVAGTPITPPFIKHVDGLPSVLGPKLGFLIKMKNKEALRFTLTLLQVSYLLKADVVPDLDPITRASSADDEVISDIVTFAKYFHDKIFTGPQISDWRNLHLSTSAGPNGPAVWGSATDLSLLSQPQITSLKALGGDEFSAYLDRILPHSDLMIRTTVHLDSGKKRRDAGSKSRKTPTTRRITTVDSPEGKKRVIAIFDYWTQTVLKPVHDWSFDQLRTVKQDMTFNQGGFGKIMINRTRYFSFDLSQATDRFPVSLQRAVLSEMIGEKKANAWMDLLVGYDFTVSWDRPNTVRYGAGQPMGAYSSWGVFSMCHHLVVQCAAYESGWEPGTFTGYCILGDDLVIADSQVASHYKRMINKLGVEISEQKSLVSDDTFEFAKRLIVQGCEVTPFPLASVVENKTSISAVWSSLFVAKDRGYTACSYNVIPRLATNLQRSCGIAMRQSYRDAKDLQALHSFTHAIGDLEERWWALARLETALSTSIPCAAHSTRFNIMETILGNCNEEYQSELLNKTVYTYINLRKDVVYSIEGYMSAGRVQGRGNDTAHPVDLEDFPLVRITSREVELISEEMFAMGDLEGAPGLVSLQYRVTPALDLSRIISRQVNKVATARQLGMLRFFRTKVFEFRKMLTDESQ